MQYINSTLISINIFNIASNCPIILSVWNQSLGNFQQWRNVCSLFFNHAWAFVFFCITEMSESRCPCSWSYWLHAEQNLYLQGKFCLGLFINIMQLNCVSGKLCVRNFILNCVLRFLCQRHPLFFAFFKSMLDILTCISENTFHFKTEVYCEIMTKESPNTCVSVILSQSLSSISSEIYRHNCTQFDTGPCNLEAFSCLRWFEFFGARLFSVWGIPPPLAALSTALFVSLTEVLTNYFRFAH